MNKVIITCDSTCDLTPEQMQEFGITALPLYIRLDEDEYRDGVTIHTAQLFEKIKETGKMPKTSALSMEDYIRAWKPIIDQGDEVVHINISSEFSACHQNATLAALELGHAYPVDSLNLSSGSGLLAIEAALMAQEGRRAEEIANHLNEKREKLDVSFVLETMDYLAKGGRCPSIAAFAAGLLRLRLCIEVRDGKMGVGRKYRGKMEPVLCEYVRDTLREAGEVELDRIYITTSGVPESVIEKVRQTILEIQPFRRVLVSIAGCTVASHCGPGTLGILFFKK